MSLAPYAAHPEGSKGRRIPILDHPFRSIWQRDRERIIHANAFRAMEYKTQVFLNREGARFRSRLTHTIETAQIARAIASALNLNEELTEAISLAHDIGHTPFGHAGENELNELMKNHGGFDHNLHGLRLVDVLEKRYAAYDGLNVTYEVREAFVRHHDLNAPLDSLLEEFQQAGAPLLETQVTVFADEIAYVNHDVDDGLYAGILTEEILEQQPLWRKAIATV